MKSKSLSKPSSLAIVFWLSCLGSAAAQADDAVVRSFERMLEPRPIPAPAVRPGRLEVDPLQAAIVIPLRDGVGRPAASAPADTVLHSFERLFSHVPNRVAPPLPAGLGDDPLIAAMVEPLRTWLAGEAAATPRAAGTSATMTAERLAPGARR